MDNLAQLMSTGAAMVIYTQRFQNNAHQYELSLGRQNYVHLSFGCKGTSCEAYVLESTVLMRKFKNLTTHCFSDSQRFSHRRTVVVTLL